jgi:hypothetical protein
MLTVTLEGIEDGKTKITLRQVGIPSVMTEFARLGWERSFDRLADSEKCTSQAIQRNNI